MKRPLSHQIDEQAQRIFRASIPDSWVVNEHTTDYGKDYHVEIVDECDELTGITFYVQLKGQRTVDIDRTREHVKYSLQAKHFEYYTTKVRDMPVYLVVVSTTENRAWYLFLQRELKNLRLNGRASKTIRIPVSNDCGDFSMLKDQILEDVAWLRARTKVSPAEIARAVNEDIRSLDPRFDAILRVEGENTCVQLLPREPVQFQMKILGDPASVSLKVDDLIGRGLPVEFDAGELEVLGSPLFDQISQRGATIHTETKIQVQLSLMLFNVTGDEVGSVRNIPAICEGGTRELRCVSDWEYSPLSLTVPCIARGRGGRMTWRLDFHSWDNFPLLQLPYFEQLLALLSNFEHVVSGQFSVEFQGNTAFTISMNMGDHREEWVGLFMRTINKLRRVMKHFDRNPKWSFEQFTDDFVDDVESTHKLLFEPLVGENWSGRTVNYIAETDEELPTGKKEYPVFAITMKHSVNLLGEVLELGDARIEYSHVSVEYLHEAGDGNMYKIAIAGSDKSECREYLERRSE